MSGILGAPLVELIGGHEHHDVVQRRWRAAVPVAQVARPASWSVFGAIMLVNSGA